MIKTYLKLTTVTLAFSALAAGSLARAQSTPEGPAQVVPAQTLQEQLNALKAEVASLQAIDSTLKSEVGHLQTSNAALQSEVGSLQTSNATLQSQLARYDQVSSD